MAYLPGTPSVGSEPGTPGLERLFDQLLGATHLTPPDELARLLAEHAANIGIQDLVLYLLDYEQAHLAPLGGQGGPGEAGVLRVDGTVGGRAFAEGRIIDLEASDPHRRQLWVPLLDGTDRLGVIAMNVPAPEGHVEERQLVLCERYAHLAAQLVMTKGAYSDIFELARRRQPLSVAAELQRRMLPPSTVATEDFVLSGIIEPCYSAGGDSFDYAINDSVAHLAVFDAMGHGLSAASTASIAVAAYRNSRRRSLDLIGTYVAMDDTLVDHFGGERYATAVLARLDLGTGLFSWINAGHVPPLLMRDGRLVRTLDMTPSTPVGMPFGEPPVRAAQERLQPGDRVLLYTDGVIEARTSTGEFFTAERLAEFLEHEAAGWLPAPETLRRLRRAIIGHQDGLLQDDATALLFEWRRGTERAVVPQTV